MRPTALALLLAVASAGRALADVPPPELGVALSTLREPELAWLKQHASELEPMNLYTADLVVDPLVRTASGTELVLVRPTADGRELWVRVTPNANHPGAVKLVSVKLDGKAVDAEQVEPSLYRVPAKKRFRKNDELRLELGLSAVLPLAPDTALSPGAGLSRKERGDYGAFSVAPEVAALVGLLPMVAPLKPDGRPFAGPVGLGDLGTFAPSAFLVSARVPRGFRVVAPGQALGEVPESGGQVRFTYATATARDFPLFVVKGYEVASKQLGDVTVESHYLKGHEAAGQKVLEAAARSLGDLEARLGTFPSKHFRVVEARLADGAGGMEFPGLVSISRSLYEGTGNPLGLLGLDAEDDPALASLLGGLLGPLLAETLELTVDHEVAHQYFAMLVGSDAVDQPVVDEALAQHVALLLTEWHHGKAAAEKLRSAQLKAAYQLFRMMGGHDAAADRKASDFGSNAEYAALVYGKAPLVYDEYRKVLGDAAWLEGLSRYVAAYRHRWAGPTSLGKVLAKVAPDQQQKLEALRVRWLEEAHGDEDLGQLDLGTFAGGTGQGSLQGIDPKVMQQYQKLLESLLDGK